MKRMKAFLTALVLFLATVGICHLYISDKAEIGSAAFGTMPSEKKGTLRVALTENMPKDGIPVFGSSEFQHGSDTVYHPASVFADSDFHPMLIGAGYYQCLSHAVTLASIADSMEIKKAALILSPQWFRKTGVVDQAYASRFSETHYAGAMDNRALSDETKQYISDRTQELLNVDPKTRKRALMHDNVLWKGTAGTLETVREQSWMTFLHEKELFETAMLGTSADLKETPETSAAETEKISAASSGEPDWQALLELAELEGKMDNQNEFYINDASYKRLEAHLEKKKDMNRDAVKGYQTGPEYDDLACFLKVCQELDVEPLIVIVPVNGYYYDYTGFPAEARQNYYKKVKAVAKKYGAQIADFSDQEYTQYFFEDRVHLGKKGWVMVDESLYRFYKEAR